jgi:hypothetical protein
MERRLISSPWKGEAQISWDSKVATARARLAFVMTIDERVTAVESLRFMTREARFSVMVALHKQD